MATYAIGDVQGCFDPLTRLIEEIKFQPSTDRLWLVGDLVNRGTKNVQVLRWAKDNGVTSVLGNHDLHLIARFHGLAKEKKRDTVEDVLKAKDGEALVQWLMERPLIHVEGGWVLVHAGLLPGGTVETAQTWARKAEGLLRRSPEQFFSLVKEKQRTSWADAKTDDEKLATTVAALTRIRMVDRSGAMITDFDGPLSEARADARPWFEGVGELGKNIVFGHWAALGLHLTARACAIDSGCVWGNRLTALRLEDRKTFQIRP
ncbi:MAG: symmetrical bis(5'-nucleosyl)-tetraphosphatase [Myxococcaceae bacterium]